MEVWDAAYIVGVLCNNRWMLLFPYAGIEYVLQVPQAGCPYPRCTPTRADGYGYAAGRADEHPYPYPRGFLPVPAAGLPDPCYSLLILRFTSALFLIRLYRAQKSQIGRVAFTTSLQNGSSKSAKLRSTCPDTYAYL